MARTWQDNADEFGALTKQGKDVRLALLVACSVSEGEGDGVAQSGPTAPKAGTIAPPSKVSARTFAKRSGIPDHKRVLRHLDAWNELAATGLVKHSDELEPSEALTYEITDEALTAWGKIGLGPTTLGAIKGNPKKVIEAVTSDPDFAKKIADDPEAVEAIITQAIERTSSSTAVANAVAKAMNEDPDYSDKVSDQLTKKGVKRVVKRVSAKKETRAAAKQGLIEAWDEEEAKKEPITSTYNPDDDPVEGLINSRQSASDLLLLIHVGAVKLKAAISMWEKACDDLTDEDLREAMPSVIEAIADSTILKSRMDDLVASRTVSP